MWHCQVTIYKELDLLSMQKHLEPDNSDYCLGRKNKYVYIVWFRLFCQHAIFHRRKLVEQLPWPSWLRRSLSKREIMSSNLIGSKQLLACGEAFFLG